MSYLINLRRSLKLRIIILILVGILPMILFSFLVFLSYRSIFTTIFLNKLEAIANAQESRIENAINNAIGDVKLITSRTTLRNNLSEHNRIRDSGLQQDMNLILKDAMGTREDAIKEISLLSLESEVVASTNPKQIGSTNKDEPYFIEGKKDVKLTDVFKQDDLLFVRFSGPIVLGGSLIGVLTVVWKADDFLGVTQDYRGLGRTGESLIVKRAETGDGLYLTLLRFDATAALKPSLDKYKKNTIVAKAISGYEGSLTNEVDYRGKPVLAVSRHIDNVDWWLVVKVDKSEVYKPIVRLQYVLAFSVLASLIVIFLIYLLADTFLKPKPFV